MLSKIKTHFNKSYNLVFWVLFAPAMIWILLGIHELYTTFFDLLTKQDHLQFFLRFFFPISVALLVTSRKKTATKERATKTKDTRVSGTLIFKSLTKI